MARLTFRPKKNFLSVWRRSGARRLLSRYIAMISGSEYLTMLDGSEFLARLDFTEV